MAQILTEGAPQLAERCKPWVFGGGGNMAGGAANEAIERHELAELLNRTMRKAGGVGLAAPQIGILRRVFCIALGPSAGLVCFNPQIVTRIGGGIWKSEGCLSFPGVFIRVRRHEGVRVKFQTAAGALIERELWGREAHAFQHELDHLDGRTLPDMIPAQAWLVAKLKAERVSA